MKFRLVSFLVYCSARLLAGTLRLRVVGEERVTSLWEQGQAVMFVTWHGRTLVPLNYFRGHGFWAIISTSRDGEYQDRIFKRFGWQTVRGSTSARGAVRAALAMTKHLRDGQTVAHTPDGPRGPLHQVHPGTIFLAQKSGCPIIPAGISASPRKLMRTWDRYMLPYPFARAAIVFGEPIYIPADAESEEEQRRWAAQIGAAIEAVEAEAERLVGVRPVRESASQDRGQWRRA